MDMGTNRDLADGPGTKFKLFYEDVKDGLIGCLKDPSDPMNVIDDTTATVATAFANAAICFLFCLCLICCCCQGKGSTGSSANMREDRSIPPSELTPLARFSSQSTIILSKRTPYKEILPLFFFVYGAFFGIDAFQHMFDFQEKTRSILLTTMTCLLGLSASLLLGLCAMDSIFYLRNFRVIKAPITYLWILLVLASVVGAVFAGSSLYFYIYFFLVSFTHLIISATQFRRLDTCYALLQVFAMVCYCVAILVYFVLTQLCSESMIDDENSCPVNCPLPEEGVFNPDALFHAIVFIGSFFFGIAKLRQVKVEK